MKLFRLPCVYKGRHERSATRRSSIEDVLQKTQIQQFEEAFRFLDKDGDGSITKEELSTALKSLGQNPTEEELRNMIEEVHPDAEGTIHLTDFLNLMATKIKESDANMAMEQAFYVIDKDGDGYISHNELREVIMNIGEKITDEDLHAMIRLADIDDDGRINFQEFLQVMLAS